MISVDESTDIQRSFSAGSFSQQYMDARSNFLAAFFNNLMRIFQEIHK